MLRKTPRWWRVVSGAALCAALGATGCSGLWDWGGDDPPDAECAGQDGYCNGDAAVSCQLYDEAYYYWSTRDCSAAGNTCHDFAGSPECVLKTPADPHTIGACIDGKLHQGRGGFVLADAADCIGGGSCRVLPDLDGHGEPTGESVATCALDTTPCGPGVHEECRNGGIVFCTNGYASSVARTCPQEHPCVQAGTAAKCSD